MGHSDNALNDCGIVAIRAELLDKRAVDLDAGELCELDLGVREPGGSVGICSNAALPPSLPAQWLCEVLREVAGAYRAER